MEVANEAYMKHCHFCGKEVIRPILHKGYVFCSNQCKESFISHEKRPNAKKEQIER